ncbi:MAG: M24 family metallopeptidase [Candidatus Bruticola sp.]
MSEVIKTAAERLQEALDRENLQGAILTSAESIRYFSGFSSSDGCVFVGQGRIYLVTDSRYWAQAEVQCPQADLVKFFSHKHRSLAQALSLKLQADKLASGRLAVEGRSLTLDNYLNLKQELSDWTIVSSSPLIDSIRLIKTAQELAAIGKAAQVADKAWAAAIPHFKAGISEADFCAELEYQMQKCGARKPSFDTIVASGLNGAYPHATVTNRIIQEGELVTVDFGCIVDGWCSDITRTIWVGQLNEEMISIWSVVRKAQRLAIEQLRPGLTGSQVDGIARRTIEEAGYGEYFSHSLGHGVGLAVHEGPGLRRESSIVLKTGMTVTIEPGIYVPGLGGCRIEDLLFLSDDSSELLSHAPYQIPGQSHPAESFGALLDQ